MKMADQGYSWYINGQTLVRVVQDHTLHLSKYIEQPMPLEPPDLFQIIRKCDLEHLKTLPKDQLYQSDEEARTALYYAIKSGNLAMVRYLYRQGIKSIISYELREKIARLFFEYTQRAFRDDRPLSTPPPVREPEPLQDICCYDSPLLYAASLGQIEIFEWLHTDSGLSTNGIRYLGAIFETPLSAAIKAKQREMVTYLLENYPSLLQQIPAMRYLYQKHYYLIKAIETGDLFIFNYLYARDKRSWLTAEEYNSPLAKAIDYRRIDFVETMLADGQLSFETKTQAISNLIYLREYLPHSQFSQHIARLKWLLENNLIAIHFLVRKQNETINARLLRMALTQAKENLVPENCILARELCLYLLQKGAAIGFHGLKQALQAINATDIELKDIIAIGSDIDAQNPRFASMILNTANLQNALRRENTIDKTAIKTAITHLLHLPQRTDSPYRLSPAARKELAFIQSRDYLDFLYPNQSLKNICYNFLNYHRHGRALIQKDATALWNYLPPDFKEKIRPPTPLVDASPRFKKPTPLPKPLAMLKLPWEVNKILLYSAAIGLGILGTGLLSLSTAGLVISMVSHLPVIITILSASGIAIGAWSIVSSIALTLGTRQQSIVVKPPLVQALPVPTKPNVQDIIGPVNKPIFAAATRAPCTQAIVPMINNTLSPSRSN